MRLLKQNAMLLIHRIWNWCRRFRYRCGYGVHSPSDFFLITSVIYEGSPYYAYETLRNMPLSKSLPHYREKVNRLLFRLVNFYRPALLMEVGEGNGDSFRYMQAARPSVKSVGLKGLDEGETLRKMKSELVRMNKLDFLHIGFTPYYIEAFEAALPYLHEGSCVVVGDIYASKEREAWWKSLVEDERVRISFDLYDIGILLFESKRFKQNYKVNFF